MEPLHVNETDSIPLIQTFFILAKDFDLYLYNIYFREAKAKL